MLPDEAREYIEKDPRNAEVLQPYIIGRDLNRRPDFSGSRWIINFQDWPLERCEEYPLLIERVRRLVKPERDKKKRAQRRDRWWIYAERAPELYATIAGMKHVLAISRVGNSLQPIRIATGPVLSMDTVVFALADFGSQAILSSSAHTCWALRYASMRRTIRYIPSEVFLTFPRPLSTHNLVELGERLDVERRSLMLSRGWGVMETYRRVHDPAITDTDVLSLRRIHSAIDQEVLAAYGWSDLDPQIGHHRTKIGMRWTVSLEARFELLDRLLEENQRRAEASGVVLS